MNSVAALLIFLLLRFPAPTSTHHIVFEEIGEMAGAFLTSTPSFRLTFPGLTERPTPFTPKSTTFAEITTSLKPKSIRRCATLRTLSTNSNLFKTSNISDEYKKGTYKLPNRRPTTS